MKTKKVELCELCEEFPATDTGLGVIDRICTRCHGLRLSGDLNKIMAIRRKKQEENEKLGNERPITEN